MKQYAVYKNNKHNEPSKLPRSTTWQEPSECETFESGTAQCENLIGLGKLFNGKQENMGGSDAIKQNEAYFPDLCCDSS